MPSRFPFPIPAGWFFVSYSDELAPGEVKTLHYFGQDLVLYREQSGSTRLVDAYCPHLGAHLGYGGTVEGDRLRCPFHGWQFDGMGRCAKVPYTERVPSTAKLEAWPVVERNGFILTWHHPTGDPPFFQIPELDHFQNPEWTPYDRYEWEIASCCQEIFENSADGAHFRFVHGTKTVPATEYELRGCRMLTRSRMKMPTPRGPIDGGIDGDVYGPGYGVFRFTGIIETLLINLITPIDDEHVEFRYAISVHSAGEESNARGVGQAITADLPWAGAAVHHLPARLPAVAAAAELALRTPRLLWGTT